MKWFLKQLLPLRYQGTYTISGSRPRCVWRMWFGRCFRVKWTPA